MVALLNLEKCFIDDSSYMLNPCVCVCLYSGVRSCMRACVCDVFHQAEDVILVIKYFTREIF